MMGIQMAILAVYRRIARCTNMVCINRWVVYIKLRGNGVLRVGEIDIIY
jgi:hypothetical protein